MMRLSIQRAYVLIGSVLLLTLPAFADEDSHAFIQNLPNITTTASTVPANGDVNPDGVAVVSVTAGALVKGDILVSNFNNSSKTSDIAQTTVNNHGGHIGAVIRLTITHKFPGRGPFSATLSQVLWRQHYVASQSELRVR